MAGNVRAPLAASVACAGALVFLAVLALGFDPVQRLDAALLARAIAAPGTGAESLATGLVRLADPPALLLFLALATAVGLLRRRPAAVVAAIVVVAGANLTTQLLKVALAHPRFQAALGADQIAWNSFPSGHATAAASAVAAFAFVLPASLRPALAALGACLVAAVGCSVMILSWHYPSDVLGGLLVVAAWGLAALAALPLFAAGYRPARQPGRRAAISVK
ncbi:MAG TPA: phosphatase PAP2 family protein [Solirubrobacterales bacterium]|nr:phosphatase PAP2 family protein [Solirubrobacterales bacterium]